MELAQDLTAMRRKNEELSAELRALADSSNDLQKVRGMFACVFASAYG